MLPLCVSPHTQPHNVTKLRGPAFRRVRLTLLAVHRLTDLLTGAFTAAWMSCRLFDKLRMVNMLLPAETLELKVRTKLRESVLFRGAGLFEITALNGGSEPSILFNSIQLRVQLNRIE